MDEPTTNLDVRNIEGLVEALASILNEKKQDNNFQMIIITHDKDFLDLLGKQHCDFFWRVEKDDKGYSKIAKENIEEL